MARIEGTETQLRLLVNCKTYPAVSTKYTETVCTGGVQPNGDFVRLYPIPFRFLPKEEQFSRWNVIDVRAYRDTKDNRPESWHLVNGTPIKVIKYIGSEIQRWQWMQPTIFNSTEEMESRGLTNGCVAIEPLELYWKEDKAEWSQSQLQEIRQGDLFATPEQKQAMGERVPWQFRLKYRQVSTGVEEEKKVLAWSYYAGFVRNQSSMTDEQALDTVIKNVAKSIFNPSRAVFAIFGTHSRFKQWMISGLYHLPREIANQRTLL